MHHVSHNNSAILNTGSSSADTVIVLDFETTGLSPKQGDRAIEIGAVRIEQGEVTGRFQQLMNPGFRINGFIEDFTGISNTMLQKAPPCDEVMDQFADFIGGHNLVAHNASFDRSFLDAELNLINRHYSGSFACTLLLARRLYQNAPNHKLGTLVKFKNIPNDGVFHRALADSEVTSKLWLLMLDDISAQHQLPTLSFPQMLKLCKTPKASVHKFLASCK